MSRDDGNPKIEESNKKGSAMSGSFWALGIYVFLIATKTKLENNETTQIQERIRWGAVLLQRKKIEKRVVQPCFSSCDIYMNTGGLLYAIMQFGQNIKNKQIWNNAGHRYLTFKITCWVRATNLEKFTKYAEQGRVDQAYRWDSVK